VDSILKAQDQAKTKGAKESTEMHTLNDQVIEHVDSSKEEVLKKLDEEIQMKKDILEKLDDERNSMAKIMLELETIRSAVKNGPASTSGGGDGGGVTAPEYMHEGDSIRDFFQEHKKVRRYNCNSGSNYR